MGKLGRRTRWLGWVVAGVLLVSAGGAALAAQGATTTTQGSTARADKAKARALGRGAGWEGKDLQFYVKAGKNEDNFYLYHVPARTTSWEPEVVVEFSQWLALRARIELAWLQGDPPQVYAGCPDTTLVPFDSAYVMCEGPYIVHVRDPATAPPNLAAVQELAAGIWRVDERASIDQAELWVDASTVHLFDPSTGASLARG